MNCFGGYWLVCMVNIFVLLYVSFSHVTYIREHYSHIVHEIYDLLRVFLHNTKIHVTGCVEPIISSTDLTSCKNYI
jgi:hypothetical protein